MSLFHLLYTPCICDQCLHAFSQKNVRFYIDNIPVTILYQYNDFFRKLLYQYKGEGDFVLKDTFLVCHPEMKKKYKKHLVAIAPSSIADNQRRQFNPNLNIVKTFHNNIFVGLYKIDNYKQTKQTNRQCANNHIRIKNGEDLLHQKILLFDDVITSGSTIKACIELIKPYHPQSIEVLILASHQI